MRTIQKLMIKHPTISILLIFPFALILTYSIFSLIIDVVLPIVFSFWIAGWVYREIAGHKKQPGFYGLSWFIRNQRL